MNLSSNAMNKKAIISVLLISVALVACRGSDETDISDPRFPVTPDPDAFAAFLNTQPGVPENGAADGEVDNVKDFPEAYYNTIDPAATRDTLSKWQTENGFLNADGTAAECNPASCRQTHVKFRDTKDLGYGRSMHMRWNTVTNDIAVYVENFQVDAVPGVPYGPLNFEALVNDDRQWNFGFNAIEFSAFPYTGAGARKFTKFYNFAGDGIRAMDASGTHQQFVDLDNRGPKPMPTACIVCHGGRGRTLVYESQAAGKKLAPTLVDGIAGDVQAQMQTIEFDTLQFANEPGFTRDENEDGIRLINQAILSTYEYRQTNFTGDGDWQADQAIELLRGRYQGDPANPSNRYDSGYVPASWSSDQNLYRSLVGPNCMVCHVLRGNQRINSVAFPSLADFKTYDKRIEHLVFEQGKMPLGLLNYSDFWDSEQKDPATLAFALELEGRVGDDQRAVRPGAPVAVISAPIIATGLDSSGAGLDIAISGAGSAFATAGGAQWTVTPSDTATITSDGPEGDAILQVSAVGNYSLSLTVNGVYGGTDTRSQGMTVVDSTDPDARPAGSAVTFYGANGVQSILDNNCVGCHSPGGGYSSMPIYYSVCQSNDINGHEFLYRSVLARVNFESPLDSLILRKPSNGATNPSARATSGISSYHGGGLALGNDADYSLLLSWILNGAPSGDIPAANTIVNAAPQCTP